MRFLGDTGEDWQKLGIIGSDINDARVAHVAGREIRFRSHSDETPQQAVLQHEDENSDGGVEVVKPARLLPFPSSSVAMVPY
jgi:hypothetical protein